MEFTEDHLLQRVKQALQQRLEKINARFGFTSLACGSDILFAEAMQERDAELHVILPFCLDDFLLTSVDHGLIDEPRWQSWRNRFFRVIDKLKPDHLHFATSEPYLGTDLLYEYVNRAARIVLRDIGPIKNNRQIIRFDPEERK